jgi:hypothetical protein
MGTVRTFSVAKGRVVERGKPSFWQVEGVTSSGLTMMIDR